MRKTVLTTLCLLFVISSFAYPAGAPKPLVRAHAHNDYMHARPLLDALDAGFCSVEADINLVDGKLLVAHELKSTKPERTLEALYLDPLQARVKQNGGRVYKDGPECTLLIDIKTDGPATYAALNAVLEKYSEMLTEYDGGKVIHRAVMVLVDGADDQIRTQNKRYTFIDGKVRHLAADPPADLVPWISDNWPSLFQWKGIGAMPEDEQARLREIVKQAHEQHRKVRFWGAPLRPAIWEELYSAGVDLLNIDNLTAGRDFLLGKGE